MIFGLFRGTINPGLIDKLHGEIVTAARDPVLFTQYGIADDLNGRFESVALHAALVLRQLNLFPPPGPQIAQDLADAVFEHFDVALRELGVGDMSVPKRMKALAEGFLGRAIAYDRALAEGHAALCAALARNVYGGRHAADRLTRYVEALDAAFSLAALADFVEGPIFRCNAAAIG
jgi:cytochrome b pre-mRNA-processing protein 3